jgi:hypothetical protein
MVILCVYGRTNRVLGFDELVFARMSPDQKLKLVLEAKRLGHVVAVTGDGKLSFIHPQLVFPHPPLMLFMCGRCE